MDERCNRRGEKNVGWINLFGPLNVPDTTQPIRLVLSAFAENSYRFILSSVTHPFVPTSLCYQHSDVLHLKNVNMFL